MSDGSDVDNNIKEKELPLHSEKVVGETAAENHHYQQFANATPEWRASFEKTLMRKVDLRLVPLLIVSCPRLHRPELMHTDHVPQQLHRSCGSRPGSSQHA